MKSGHEEHQGTGRPAPGGAALEAVAVTRAMLETARRGLPVRHGPVPSGDSGAPSHRTSQGEGPEAGFVPWEAVPLAEAVKEP